jgi:hypothetical protein
MKVQSPSKSDGIPWRVIRRSTMLVLLGAIAGCGSSYPTCVGVRGRVTYHGKPVKAGMISFTRRGQTSAAELVRPATGELRADGSYTMSTFRSGEGVLPGKYIVTIVAFDYSGKRDELQRLPSLIPTKYGSPETSGLKATVPSDASGALQLDFDLTD